MPSEALAKVRAVSFDLDDTLWHCAPAIEQAEKALFDWFAHNTPRITDAHSYESLGQFRAAHYQSRPDLHGCVTSIRVAGIKALFSEFGYPGSLAEEAFTVFYKVRSNVELYPGVADLLNTLKRRYRLAAITNGNADLPSIGLDQFELTFAADLSLPGKPAPDMFERCLNKWGLPPEALLHIGDSPESDILGGHNAGVQTLWFNQYNVPWPAHLPRPHFEVVALNGIVPLLSM